MSGPAVCAAGRSCSRGTARADDRLSHRECGDGAAASGAGVYAGRAVLEGQRHLAAISVGNNPTFHGKLTTVEAFILDFSGDLYGKTIDVEFHRWIRDMIAFAGVEPLIKQMAQDVALTRDTNSPRNPHEYNSHRCDEFFGRHKQKPMPSGFPPLGMAHI